MILFNEDWERFPEAVIQSNTKNTSFVRYSQLLQSMGVKNHLHPLQLHDKELMNIDPFSDNVYNSQELMLRIALECRRNFYYYIREVARSPAGSPEDPIRFAANRGNMALFWLFWNHITTMLIQIRQTGKSFSTDNLMTYLLNIRCKKTSINLLTKDETLRSANLDRLKKIEMELPFYLKQRGRMDIGSQEQLTVKSLGNIYTGLLPQKSEKMALNVGRGLTSPIFQIDEIAFLPNIGISLPAALAAGTAARDIARRNGDPFGIIYTTTAGKKDDRDGAYAHKLLMEAAIWSEMFMDAQNEEELCEIVRKASSGDKLVVNCTFNHRQLGYTDEWLREQIKTTNAAGEAAERDYLNHWTSGSISSPLTTELNNDIRNSQADDYQTVISRPHAYTTRWYYAEREIAIKMQEAHTLAVDTSDAVGKDDIGLVLRAVKDGSVAAAGNYNETNLITFAEWLCDWLEKYPSVTLVVERRSSGATILDYLLLMLPKRGIDPFKRIYNKIVQEPELYPEAWKEIQVSLAMRREDVYVRFKKHFGFATSATGATSRTELYSTTLQNSAKLTGKLVKDKKVIEQILGLEVRNGRIDHAAGKHDDMVIAWLLSAWILLSGRNLHYYGIQARDILVNNKQHQVENDPTAKYKRMEQEYYRQQVEVLTEQIRNERDDFAIDMLENRLRGAVMRLNESDNQHLSVDELINNLREGRKLQRRLNNQARNFSGFGNRNPYGYTYH